MSVRLAHEPWRNFGADIDAYLRATDTPHPVAELLCPNRLRELHALIVADGNEITAQFCHPGDYRTEAGFARRNDGTIEMVFAPPERVPALLEALGGFVEQSRLESLDPVLTACLLLYQLGAIHPFVDGNGRLARALAEMLLVERKAVAVALPLSIIVGPYHQLYNNRLTQVSRTGDWLAWIAFICGAICNEVSRLVPAEDAGA